MKIRNFTNFDSVNEGSQGGGNKFILVRFGTSPNQATAKYFFEIAAKNPKPTLLKTPEAFITMFETALTKEALVQGFDRLGITYNLYQVVHTSAGGSGPQMVARQPSKEQLKAQLKKALEDEDYEKATQIRDQIAAMEGVQASGEAPTAEGRVYSFESFKLIEAEEEEFVNGTNTEEFHILVSKLIDHELAEIEGGEEEYMKETCEKIKDYLIQNKFYVPSEKKEDKEGKESE